MIEIENDSVETSYQVVTRYLIEYRQGYYTRKWPFSKSRGIFFQGEGGGGKYFSSQQTLPYFLSHLFHLYEPTRTIHHLTHIFLSRIQPSSPSTGNHISKLRANKKTECFESIEERYHQKKHKMSACFFLALCASAADRMAVLPQEKWIKKEKPIFLKLSKKKKRKINCFHISCFFYKTKKKRIS